MKPNNGPGMWLLSALLLRNLVFKMQNIVTTVALAEALYDTGFHPTLILGSLVLPGSLVSQGFSFFTKLTQKV